MIFQSVTMVLIILTKFGLIKEVFIMLLNFSTSLAAECVSLNNKPCITRTTFNFFNCYFAEHYQLLAITTETASLTPVLITVL